jgi:voltage-gated potassium channel
MSNGQIRSVATKLSHSARFKKILIVLMVLVVVLGLIMAPIEQGAEGAKIHTMEDGAWYAITTMTGAGHGDMVPVTSLGRLVASVLQIVGVALFGSVVAFVSVELLRYQEDYYVRKIIERMDAQDQKLDELKKHVDYLVKK